MHSVTPWSIQCRHKVVFNLLVHIFIVLRIQTEFSWNLLLKSGISSLPRELWVRWVLRVLITITSAQSSALSRPFGHLAIWGSGKSLLNSDLSCPPKILRVGVVWNAASLRFWEFLGRFLRRFPSFLCFPFANRLLVFARFWKFSTFSLFPFSVHLLFTDFTL